MRRPAWFRATGAFCRAASRRAAAAWLTEADIDFYAGEFSRTGFRGGLNWYRNIDRNFALMAPFAGLKVTVPALYVAGDRDLVVAFAGAWNKLHREPEDSFRSCAASILLPGCGHWTQQERPRRLTRLS